MRGLAAMVGAALLAGAAAVPVRAARQDVVGAAGGPAAFVPTARSSWRARVVLPTRMRAAPGPTARLGARLPVDAPYAGGPQVLLVEAAARAADGGAWLEVQLPTRPNGSTGWVPAEAVRVSRNPWRIRVRLGARRLELVRAGRVVGRWRVAVGVASLPTPAGHFAVSEIVPQRNPAGFFGPDIITLTAHSTRLNEFDGGDGRVALHGTDLPGLLGTAASHGCVRMPNAAVARLARTVPAGTPVDVTP